MTDKVAFSNFGKGDVFKFDFEKDEWRIVHNGDEIYTLSLNPCK